MSVFDLRAVQVAQQSTRYSYIAHPTTQLRELADSEKLTQLNNKFLHLVSERNIGCTNFIEGAKVQTTAKIKIHVVPPESSGENFCWGFAVCSNDIMLLRQS